jgi:hypothetical protein
VAALKMRDRELVGRLFCRRRTRRALGLFTHPIVELIRKEAVNEAKLPLRITTTLQDTDLFLWWNWRDEYAKPQQVINFKVLYLYQVLYLPADATKLYIIMS